jgi:hypothetical protein
MCFFAEILDFKTQIRVRADQRCVGYVPGMRNEIDVDFVVGVCSCVEELDLSASAFFGRRAVEDDLAWEVGFCYCCAGGEGGCYRANRNKVVAAGMADSFQCIWAYGQFMTYFLPLSYSAMKAVAMP